MTKITRKPKKVRVFFVETVSRYPKYVCPSCHTEFIGGCIDRNTVSFKCSCGQILIVENCHETD